MPDLPIADYDQLPVSALESRVRSLEPAGVRQLRDYDVHANPAQPRR